MVRPTDDDPEEGPSSRPTADDDKDALDLFINDKIDKYKSQNLDDEELWLTYVEDDFKNWTEELFETASRTVVSKLRAVLRYRGVWVSMHKNVRMAKALYNTIHEEERTPWTDAEAIAMSDSGKPIRSDHLNHRIKRYNEGKPLDQRVLPLPPIAQPSVRQTPTSQPILPPADQRTIYPTSYQFSGPLPSQPPNQQSTVQELPTSRPLQSTTQEPESEDDEPDDRPKNWGKEIANLTKCYTEDSKYGSQGDNFTLKLRIFRDICNRVGVPKEAYPDALPVMLKGLALDYYYTSLLDVKNKLPFDKICTNIQLHFEDANYVRGNLTEWNKVDLDQLKSEHPDKSTSHCFELLVAKLQTLRHACRNTPACQIACSTPPDSLNSLITSLKSSITTYEHAHKITEPSAFTTDRRYHSNRLPSTQNRYRPQGRSNRLQNTRTKRCFICKKEDCWSTNHSESEQRQAKDRFKSTHASRFSNRFGTRFEKSYRQYVMEYEGDDDTVDEVFQTISLEDNTPLLTRTMTTTTISLSTSSHLLGIYRLQMLS